MGDRVEAEHRGDRAGPRGAEGQTQTPANLRSLRDAPLARRQGGPGTGRDAAAGLSCEPPTDEVDETRSRLPGTESGIGCVPVVGSGRREQDQSIVLVRLLTSAATISPHRYEQPGMWDRQTPPETCFLLPPNVLETQT